MTEQALDQIKKRLSDPAFLANRGLSNEVGVHVFCYAPEDELTVRAYVRRLKEETGTPYRIIERDLFEIFLSLLRDKRILEQIPQLEEKRGPEYLLAQLRKAASPEGFLERMDYDPHREGDVLFLTGVGAVCPFMRAHKLLDRMQHLFADVPVVLFYPGTFDGQSLSLFRELSDGNYYRAFNLL